MQLHRFDFIDFTHKEQHFILPTVLYNIIKSIFGLGKKRNKQRYCKSDNWDTEQKSESLSRGHLCKPVQLLMVFYVHTKQNIQLKIYF